MLRLRPKPAFLPSREAAPRIRRRIAPGAGPHTFNPGAVNVAGGGGHAFGPPSGGGATTDPNVASINATGWDVTYATTPAALNPLTSLVLSRAGFTAAAATTTYTEALTLTQRVRLPYPNQATLDPTRVALSDYVYSTDTAGIVTNNSTMASPAPICNWILPDRQTVGNTLTAEIVSFHRNARNGKQIACVVFTATDGTLTVSQTVSTPAVSSTTGLDQNAVISYSAALDITSLAAGQITLNAKVYPWIGNSSSVADSSVNTQGTRSFCPQIFLKNTTYIPGAFGSPAPAPPLAYVSTSGSDAGTIQANGSNVGGTAVVSTNAATAAAHPFLTIAGALNGLKLATSLTGGKVDGGRVRLMAGTQAIGTIPGVSYTNSVGECVIEGDPNATPATAILNLAATTNFRMNWLRFQNLTISRTTTAQIGVTNSVTFHNVIYIASASSASYISTSGSQLRIVGGSITGDPLTGATPNASISYNLIRGWSATGSNFYCQSWLVVGCNFVGCGILSMNSYSESGIIVAFNTFYKVTVSGVFFGIGATSTPVSGVALVQNVIEFTGTGTGANFHPSADQDLGNTTHILFHHNTLAGFYTYGKSNVLYNETLTSGGPHDRTHVLASSKGNIHVCLNTKHDVFTGVNESDADAPNHVGGWSFMYGAGCNADISQFADAAGYQNGTGSSFSQAFPGLHSVNGTSTTVPVAVNFANPKSTTAGPTVGAGLGNYAITTGSVAKGLLPDPVLAFDLTGAARHASNTSAGAYEL